MKALFILTGHQPDEETENYFTKKIKDINEIESITKAAPNVYLFDLSKASQDLADLQHFAKTSNYPYLVYYFDQEPVSYVHS